MNFRNPETGKLLLFDFFIPEKNTLIEFDGKQHFRETKFFKSSLKEIQKRDEIKNGFCEREKIKLIRIPYSRFNFIEDILFTHQIFS